MAIGSACWEAGRIQLAADVFRAYASICRESVEARTANSTAMFAQGVYNINL